MPRLICSLCPPGLTSRLDLNLTEFLKHIKLFHAHQPSFSITCGLNGCTRNFTNFRTFRNHVSAFHSGDPTVTNQCSTADPGIPTNESDSVDNADADGEGDVSSGNTHDMDKPSNLKTISALFLMGLKEKYKLTQVALQGIIQGVTSLFQSRLLCVQSEVNHLLFQSEVSPAVVRNLGELFSEDRPSNDPFWGLHTPYQQMSYYRSHFRLIEPNRVTLGERRVWKGYGAKRQCVEKQDEIMYVPLLDTIENLLQRDSFLKEVQNSHQQTAAVISDFCDGEIYHRHPLFSKDPTALQIFLYYDDLEVANPLGSKSKIHKLSIFYFNIHPKNRSKLSSIQLLAIVKTTNLKLYGMDRVLAPFVEDIKKLENGYTFYVAEDPVKLYGTLALVSADNLGSLAVGGFKESCSSYRMCRHCMAISDTASNKFAEADFVLRDSVTHKQQCDEIEADGNKSIEYGINRNSSLNSLKYFHVCDGGLIPDIMHDILEGALQYEIKLMLLMMIQDEGFFSLDVFNSRLMTTELGYMEVKDRPSSISHATLTSLGHSLKQNAAQMWLFGRILPLIIGDFVPEDSEHWSNYLRMMEIVDILFSPDLVQDNAPYLAILISDHHEQFVQLYPHNSVIPKMHFMIHMPRLMLQFGPLIRHWTMRYEAKHAYFKSLSQSMGNFINVPYSLALRHQLHQCYLKSSELEVDNNITIGPGNVIVPEEVEEVSMNIVTAFCAKWVIINGTEYRCPVAVVHKVEDDLPQIAVITKIYVINGNTVIFRAENFSTDYYQHYRAYRLKPMNTETNYYHSSLLLHIPLHIRSPRVLPNLDVILLPYYCISQ